MRIGRGVIFNMGEWGCLETIEAQEEMQRTLGNEKPGIRQGLDERGGLRERSREKVL